MFTPWRRQRHVEREQISLCSDRKQVQIWKQTHHRGSDHYNFWCYSKTSGHTLGRQTMMHRVMSTSTPEPYISKQIRNNNVCLPKLLTVHLEAVMLDKHIFFRFTVFDHRRKFKNTLSQIPYRLTPKPFKLQQPCPPLSYLSSWSAAKPVMLQSYKSTHLLLYWTITYTSHLTFFALRVKSVVWQKYEMHHTCNAENTCSNKRSCTDGEQRRAGAAQRQLTLRPFYYWRYDAWWCSPPTTESSYSFTVFPGTQCPEETA